MAVLFRFFIILASALYSITPVVGQQFVDDPAGPFVDEPITPIPLDTGPARVISYQPKNVLYSGLINQGYEDSVFEAFTGDSVFSKSKSATSFFVNLTWKKIQPLRIQEQKIKFAPAFSYGAEVVQFSENTESALSAKSGHVTAPSVSMEIYFWSASASLFFGTDPFTDQINPYFGAGWGIITGDISSRRYGKSYNTTMQGLHTYNNVGVQININERIGIAIEFRQSNSNSVKTSNDPFGQGTDSASGLKFVSTAVNMLIYWVL
ncbi:MAG: hypothetical protein GY786_24035 [Proteobacteria bacterium]|nr:hypothetical protein [Pseudomonadota bacterium]